MKNLWRWFVVGLATLGVWGVVLGTSFVFLAGFGVFMSLGRLLGPLFALPILIATLAAAGWVGSRIDQQRGGER